MNSSEGRKLSSPLTLENVCQPTGSNVARGKSNNKRHAKFNRNDQNCDIHKAFLQDEIEEMFGKYFSYHKNLTSNYCRLPEADELFKEYYQLEALQEMRMTLNGVKSKLNDYVLADWSLHTRRNDPAGEIPRRLKTETNAEFVTVAWCKMYECFGRYPELIKGPKINSLHICEAPGAFITALNHYLYANFDKNMVKWNWLATTLNPYYEGNPINGMIIDDRFLFYTLDNWLFHKDFTGNIIDMNNLKHLQQQCENRLGAVHLITADGSVDCIESPDCQEENVALLHYAELVAALTILSEGGSFVLKMFTMYEASSVNTLYLLNCVFEKVHVFKPCTSKRGNSEVYVVCLNYRKQTKNLFAVLHGVKLKLEQQNNMSLPLFAKSTLPVDFLMQHEICCRIFMIFQINAIEQNISSYEIRPHKSILMRLKNLKTAVCNEYYKRYKICNLPDEFKILNKFRNCMEKGHKNQFYTGSFSERKKIKDSSTEEQVFKCRKLLNDLEKMLKEDIQLNEIKYHFENEDAENESHVKLTLYRGQGVASLNSSLFANIHLLIMGSKLNNLFACNILHFQNSRFEYYGNDSLISVNFNDFATASGRFCLQQENFFKKLISDLLSAKPKDLKFINMPFLTHYAVSILRFLSSSIYSKLSISFECTFTINLTNCQKNFTENLEELQYAMSSSQDQDILCFLNVLLLHRNNFNKTLCAFNNMLLLQNFNDLLSN